jgi:hypothetical protein
LSKELAEAMKSLRELQLRLGAEPAEAEKGQSGPRKAMGVPLGPEATGLRVVTMIRLKPVPTGVYHLLDSDSDPLTLSMGKGIGHLL